MIFNQSSEKTVSKVVNMNVLGTTDEENNAFLKGKIVELEEKLAQVRMCMKFKSANTYKCSMPR